MKRASIFIMLAVLLLSLVTSVSADTYYVKYDFNNAWTGDYAPGWENSAYRHGSAPTGKMMEHVDHGRNGTDGMRLVAKSTPEDWMWWAAVNPTNLYGAALSKNYDPWVSVWYYDKGWEYGPLHQAGQLFTVPSWVNPYISGEDWTDVQFGARVADPETAPPADNYYYVAAGQNSPGWVDTLQDRRANNWVNLKMQLSSADGKIHFYIRYKETDSFVEVGQTYRSDYIDLGTETGLYTMFTDPLGAWGDDLPDTYWDDFEVGSNYVPEPMSMILGFMGLSSVAGLKRLRRK